MSAVDHLKCCLCRELTLHPLLPYMGTSSAMAYGQYCTHCAKMIPRGALAAHTATCPKNTASEL
jgi:hypothetical protein